MVDKDGDEDDKSRGCSGQAWAGLMEWRFQVAISAPPSTLATSMHLITSTSNHLGVPSGTSKYFQVAILAL